jgi:tRNA(Leu) C34 or U34 (ribose-2'-O)-methylase TrmL
VLANNNAPLFLVGAVASNVKPDKSVLDAIALDQAADKQVAAMTKIDNFIKADPTGVRAYIYKMNAMRTIVETGERNGSTFIFGDGFGKGDISVAVPANK